MKSALHHNYALALRRQYKNEEALEQFRRAKALEPDQPLNDALSAEILQDLGRYEEALALSQLG